MKIAFVIDDSLDRTDGVQQYVLTLGSWLVEQGHEVHYLCGETKRRDLPHVHSLTKNIKLSFNQNRLSIPGWARKSRITELLAKEQFDVIHVQMPYSPMLASRIIASAPAQTAVVGTFHVYPAGWLPRWGTWLLGVITRRSQAQFTKMISVSQPAQSFMKQSWGRFSQVIPNPVNLQLATKAKAKKKAASIVFLGRLVERKGARYLLEAFAAMPKRGAYTLTIAGSGPLDGELHQLAEKLGIAGQTNFTGFVAEDKKFALLASADVAVFPSTGGESFGISLTEAMAAGTVVLAGDNPGYAAVLQASPRSLIQPQKTQEFSRQLSDVVANKDLRDQIYAEQQALVTQFDIAQVGPQVEAVYESALQLKRKVT